MEIRIRVTGQVMAESEFRALYPNTSFPNQIIDSTLDSLGADTVFESTQPQVTRYQTSYRDGVQQINGKWYTKYAVADMDAAARSALDATQAQAMRSTRNAKLSACDWTQLADTPGQTRAAYVQYRQALRDVPQQVGFPWEVTWPTEP